MRRRCRSPNDPPDDFALGHARYALGLALMHRASPADRERGLTALTQLRDMCLHEHWTLSEAPEIEAFIAWEHARLGDLDGAIATLRAAVDDLFQAGQFAWCIPPTGMFVETLITRGGEADLQEAQTAIERLAAAPTHEMVDREIWLLRLRALLAGARGDETAHRDLLQQHRAMATRFGRLGHMAMSDSWTVRAAAAGARPNIICFDEDIPKPLVEQGYSMVDGAEASSLTVFPGYRFVRRAAAHDIPTAIVNRGRGDGLAALDGDPS